MATRNLLTAAAQLIGAGDCHVAAAMLGNALTDAKPSEKARIAAPCWNGPSRPAKPAPAILA